MKFAGSTFSLINRKWSIARPKAPSERETCWGVKLNSLVTTNSLTDISYSYAFTRENLPEFVIQLEKQCSLSHKNTGSQKYIDYRRVSTSAPWFRGRQPVLKVHDFDDFFMLIFYLMYFKTNFEVRYVRLKCILVHKRRPFSAQTSRTTNNYTYHHVISVFYCCYM